ncbi:HdeD family acid-resistance protein [Halococcus hamelinensis]|uniref:HdeD family acid-resistance protein n=1 Tax=Halococcus hamelinensis 100A6 TaxID=1132509 RepID=M0LWG0_9EURY|nr:DUF308 domain-containing protein [Halococcus hamelinensis]EMA36430.1 hypothetical protein C447_14261 [Halococcus hamelinensis 100A6]
MSSNIESNQEDASLATSWRVLAGVGALIAVLGLIAIVSPFVTGVALSVILGVLLVVGGVGHGVHAVSARGWRGFVWEALLAALYVVGGVALFVNPVVGLLTLTLVLAAFFVAEGVVGVVLGLRVRPAAGWGWMLTSGLVGVAAGAVVWLGWPTTALWAVGLVFGIRLLATGGAMVMLAMGSRRVARETRSIGATPRGG